MRSQRGFLATIGPEGAPHIVPVCFTWAGDVIWTAIDGKPKSGRELQRIKDVESNNRVAFTVDRWDEDWGKLAWLQARGRATILPTGEDALRAQSALKDKYPQYTTTPLEGRVIRIDVDRWVGWSAEQD